LVRRIWWDGTSWSFNTIRCNNPLAHQPLSLHLFLLSSSGEQSLIPKNSYRCRPTSHSSGAQELGTTTAQELGQPIRPSSRAEISALPPPEMLNLPHQRSRVARGGHRTGSFPCWRLTPLLGASPVRCIFSIHLSSAQCLELGASPCPCPLHLTTLAPGNAKTACDADRKEWPHPPDSRGPSCPHISGICHCRNDPVPSTSQPNTDEKPPNQTLVKKGLPHPVWDVPQTKPMHLTLPTR
jgi:hypothetical protein